MAASNLSLRVCKIRINWCKSMNYWRSDPLMTPDCVECYFQSGHPRIDNEEGPAIFISSGCGGCKDCEVDFVNDLNEDVVESE